MNYYYNKGMRVKLVIDEGFAERPIYKIKAFSTEKDKGIMMLEIIEDTFKISNKDKDDYFKKKLSELNADAMTPTIVNGIEQVKWTRDAKGNIISPFKK